MDSKASPLLICNQCNILSLTPFNSKSIMVGSGALLPVIFTVNSFSPYSNNNLFLKNILISNNMVKNSFYAFHFCIDKILYVEFDHFGFFCQGY